jgi:hypothetical protein
LTSPNETSEWYTVCSKPHSNYNLFVAVLALMAIVGIASYRFSFGTTSADDRLKKETEPKGKKKQKRKIY